MVQRHINRSGLTKQRNDGDSSGRKRNGGVHGGDNKPTAEPASTPPIGHQNDTGSKDGGDDGDS